MSKKMTAKQELLVAGVTFASTIITGNLIADLIVGIVTYSAARLFYHYYHKKMIRVIDKIKYWFKKQKQKYLKK